MEDDKSYCLTDTDMLELLDGDANLFKYSEIKNMESLDELFKNGKNKCIILYEWNEGFGHWVGLINYPDYVLFLILMDYRQMLSKNGFLKKIKKC